MKTKRIILTLLIIILITLVYFNEFYHPPKIAPESVNDSTITIKPQVIIDSIAVKRSNGDTLYVYPGDWFAEVDAWGDVKDDWYYLVTDVRPGWVKYNFGTGKLWVQRGCNHRTSKITSISCHWLEDYKRVESKHKPSVK